MFDGELFGTYVFAVAIDEVTLSTYDNGIRVIVEEGLLECKSGVYHDVIGVHAGDIVGLGLSDGEIKGGADTQVFGVLKNVNPRFVGGEFLENFPGVIGGAVINSD